MPAKLSAKLSGKLLDAMKADIGVTEASDPERVGEYLAFVGLPRDPNIPWCAAYQCFKLDEIGEPSPRAANARAFEKYGELATREPGAICVLKRGNKSWQGHVGVVSDNDDPTDDAWVTLISGNSGNSVRESKYPVADVICYRRPKQVHTSKVVKAAVTGGVSETTNAALAVPSVGEAVQEFVTQVTPAAVGLTVPHIRAVLSIITVCALLYALYDRVLKIRESGK